MPFDYDPDAPRPGGGSSSSTSSGRTTPTRSRRCRSGSATSSPAALDLQKILLLVGPTRAGKGVIARVLGALVGRGNVAGPTLASLGTTSACSR